MILKSIVFLYTTVSLTYQLKITPDELKSTWATVSAEVESRQQEGEIEIRIGTVRLPYTCDLAKTDFIGNISEAAQPYWDQVEELEKNASSQGQLGNAQLYILNATVANAAETKINSIEASGEEFMLNNSIPSYVIEDIVVYGTKVEACSDDTCASELQIEILRFYKNTTTVIDNCVNAVDAYFEKDLPEALSVVKLDREDYQEKYTGYLKDIEECVQIL